MTAKKAGDTGEAVVVAYLAERGGQILACNYHSRYGEIDVIALWQDCLCFVEVKTRRKNSQVSGELAITRNKQRRIVATALLYLQDYPVALQPRFDVAVVQRESQQVEYYAGAFDGSSY